MTGNVNVVRRKRYVLQRVGSLREERERGEVLDTLTRAFRTNVWERHVTEALWKPPAYHPEHTRVVVADGRVVSVAFLGFRRIRFGHCTIPAMTIGPVATHPEFEGHGFASALFRDAQAYMRTRGIPLAYLQGVRGFYGRLGFFPFLAKSKIVVARDNMQFCATYGRLVPMRPSDLGEVGRLYDRATRDRLCAARRDDRVWQWLAGPGRSAFFFHKPHTIRDARDRLVGYVTFDPVDAFHLREIVVAQRPAACQAALGAVYKAARRKKVEQVELKVPRDDALVTFCRQHVGGVFHEYCNPIGGALLCILDLPQVMVGMMDLLAARLRACQVTRVLEFTLATEGCQVGLRLSAAGGTVTQGVRAPVAFISERWLPGLLTGYYTPGDLRQDPGVRIPAALIGPLSILFPRCWPFVYQADNF